MIFLGWVHCTLFHGLAQIHYGQTQTLFSTILRTRKAGFSYLYVPNMIRSRACSRVGDVGVSSTIISLFPLIVER